MSDATVGLRVVVHEDQLPPRGVNVINLQVPRDDVWDGEEAIILHPKGSKEGTTVQGYLDDIRSKPHLALLNLPVVRNLQDTVVLWSAWKNAMLDTIGTIYEYRCQVILQQRCELDDEPTRIQLRELRMQLQTTMGTWREHLKFLTQQRDQLASGIHQRENDVRESLQKLQAKCDSLSRSGGESSERCIASTRVLINAASALENTQNERRAHLQRWHEEDRVTHADTLRSLIEALSHFTQGFSKDLDEVKMQSKLAQASVDESINRKQMAWHKVCQTLQGRYTSHVHNPLRKLIHDLKANRDQDNPYTKPLPTSLDIATEALDNHNDPHCVRRCEVAMMELVALRNYLNKLTLVGANEPSSVELSQWDDNATLEARKARADEERTAQIEHDQRMLSLKKEQELRRITLERAKTHMQRLQERATQLQDHVVAAWEYFDGTETVETNKRAAALTRLANQRQENLRDEMRKTDDIIHQLHRELTEARSKVTWEDRLIQANRYIAVANAVHDVCKRMRAQFEMAIHSEEMMRRIVRDQFTDSCRTFFNLSLSIIHKVLDTARSQFTRTQVRLRGIQDDIQDAVRRIDTLNKARIQQELKVNGPEIALYAALEEHVVVSNQLQQLRDSHVKTQAMCDTSDSALLLLQDLINTLQGI